MNSPSCHIFVIRAESYQIAAEFARARSGSSLPDENNSPVYPKTDEEKTFIISAVRYLPTDGPVSVALFPHVRRWLSVQISKSFLFEGLQVEDVATIVDAMHPVAVANGEIVFKQVRSAHSAVLCHVMITVDC